MAVSSIHRDNFFDVIRLVASFLVLYSHQFPLSGLAEPSFLGFTSFGGLAVIVFFGVSGYLVAQSGIRSGDFLIFMTKRIKRIFPALIFCGFVIYFFLGLALQPSMVFTKSTLHSFIDLVFLRGANAMSMANGFVYPHAIDGSLWTLPLEFLCYIILGVIFCFSKTIRPVLLVFSFMLVLSIYLLSNPTGIGFYSISIQAFVPLATSFFMGVLMSLTKSRWDFWKIKSFLFFSLFLLLISMDGTYEIKALGYVIIPVLTIIAGVSFRDKLINGRFDYSYGIYIYAFPVQQVIINYGGCGFWLSMLFSAIVTLILASLSWHLIEKRMLIK